MESILAPGLVLAERYRLVRPIGKGGSSVVWIADHVVTDKRVALKVLTKRGSDGATRFLREARITARIDHPNVVDIHDVFQLDESDELVMVMDLLEGVSLAEHLREQGALPLPETARIVLAVVSALAAAHALGVVHRDLKPENVFLTADGALRVLDFGVAKWSRPVELAMLTPDLTETGTIVGTPHYMAPEQVFGESDVDGRADVWALGVIAYECLAGRRPIEGENFGQVFKAIAVGEITPLAEHAPGLDATIARLVMRMLGRARDGRPSLGEIRAAFEGSGAGSGATPATARRASAWVAPVAVLALLGGGFAVMQLRASPAPAPSAVKELPSAVVALPPSASAPVVVVERDSGAISVAASGSVAVASAVRPSVVATPPSPARPLPGRVHGAAPY